MRSAIAARRGAGLAAHQDNTDHRADQQHGGSDEPRPASAVTDGRLDLVEQHGIGLVGGDRQASDDARPDVVRRRGDRQVGQHGPQGWPHWSGPDLAERLGITTRTVRRDVDRLRGLGYPVDADLGTHGGHRLAPTGAMPPLVLDHDEAVAIAVALRLAAGSDVRGVEDAALGALTKRAVEPLRLVHTGRRWYLAAFDVRRADWRTFRVDRIGTVANTGHRFHHVDPPDAPELVWRAVSIAPYRHTARVLVHAALAEVARTVPPTVATLHEHGERTKLLTTGSDRLEAIAMHLAGLPFDFTVLEPDALRAILQATAARLQRAAATPPVAAVAGRADRAGVPGATRGR